MADTSRKTARKALGSLLSTALVGTGKLCQAVYDHLPATFEQSPVVCVLSTGTTPARIGLGNNTGKHTFHYDIVTFVAVAESTTWNDEAEQDALDDIEAVIRGVIRTNKTNAAWIILRFAGQDQLDATGRTTNITPVKVGGHDYDMERLSVEIEVYDV